MIASPLNAAPAKKSKRMKKNKSKKKAKAEVQAEKPQGIPKPPSIDDDSLFISNPSEKVQSNRELSKTKKNS